MKTLGRLLARRCPFVGVAVFLSGRCQAGVVLMLGSIPTSIRVFLYRTVHNCTKLMQSRLCHYINAWRDVQIWRRVPSCLAQRSLRARRKVSDDHATQRTPRPITHIALYIIELLVDWLKHQRSILAHQPNQSVTYGTMSRWRLLIDGSLMLTSRRRVAKQR